MIKIPVKDLKQYHLDEDEEDILEFLKIHQGMSYSTKGIIQELFSGQRDYVPMCKTLRQLYYDDFIRRRKYLATWFYYYE